MRSRTRILSAAFALVAALAAGAVLRQAMSPGRAASRERVENFRLLDQRGLPRELFRESGAKAVVFVLQANGCMITRKTGPALADLRRRYGPRGVVFWMINAQDSREAVAKEAEEYGLDFPVLLDDARIIAPSLGFSRAPEAVVVDTADWTIAYRGAVDDRLTFGAEKPAAREAWLADALDAVLAGREPAVTRTETAGCLTNFSRPAPSYADAAKVLRAKCLTCHGPAGASPALTSQAAVSTWAPMIRESVRTRRMPPWPVDAAPSPLWGDISLTPAERGTLVRWVEAGAPTDSGPDPLAAPQPPARAALGRPDRTWTMKADHVYPARDPRIAPIEYVELEPPVDRDLWLRAISIESRNPRVKQHVNVLALPMPLDEFFRRNGHKRNGQDMLRTTLWHVFLTVRAPEEKAPPVLPEGAAYFVPKGSRLVLELHYQTSGKEERDRITVGFHDYAGKTPPKPVKMRLIGRGDSLTIPPRVKDYEASHETLFVRPVSIIGVYPHMHLRGTWMKVLSREPGKREEVLFSAPDYDFFWATWYRFLAPRRLPAGSKLVLRGSYDNSKANPKNPDPARAVPFGWSLLDEMFGARIFYTED